MTVQHWKAELLRIERDLQTLKGMHPQMQMLGEKVWRDWYFSLFQEFTDAAECLRAALLVPETPQPVAHEHSPVLAGDPARALVLVYREKVLEAFRAWDMRPGDRRSWHEVVMGVDVP